MPRAKNWVEAAARNEKIIHDYQHSDLEVRAIAAKHDVSANTVCIIIRQADVPRRPTGPIGARQIHAEIIAMYKVGMAPDRIAPVVRRSVRTVQNVIATKCLDITRG